MATMSFFTTDGAGRFDPTDYALSLWGPDALNGPAVCAVAAYAAENAGVPDGFAPARFTLELFKSARKLPTTTETKTIRDGHRIRVVEVSVNQFDGAESATVARGNVVFLKQGDNPPGARWQRPAQEQTFTPPSSVGEGYRPWFRTESQDWTTDMGSMQNADRLSLYTRPFNVVDGQTPTAFQRAVIAAESTSLVTNIGDGGIGFINCDLTVALTRLPAGDRLGVEADSHLESAGLSVGTANLYDEHGQFGVGLVTAVDNTRAMIDFSKMKPHSFRAPELS
ncbi:acyl-CoA thioesterase domain-containing protein [Gordonia sp. (in: high G+C Gram-positive bacteria)]|uniref:acyl-CoA thioesterase domain-containing protein n=1 Tax=Gordonia sp. (in: high G+C Gram-positive bacteria) TaxID=84139 RepID=UPI003C769D38